jgi:hypothetical protein
MHPKPGLGGYRKLRQTISKAVTVFDELSELLKQLRVYPRGPRHLPVFASRELSSPPPAPCLSVSFYISHAPSIFGFAYMSTSIFSASRFFGY